MDESDEAAVERVVARIRERVTPDAAERERLRSVADGIIAAAEARVADLPVDADALQVGSTARGTWISGDRDVDVFVRFPPDLSREKLETYGLEVGRAAVPEGHEEYAEHPYITGTVDGFDVDLVPCYRVADATAIQSAVDRTPFHNRYLEACIDADLAGEVRVTKAFLKGIGIYGSDLRTEGFSGYLTELLVLEYGSARALLAAAADWQPPVTFDPENHAAREFDDPLVVVDPTDPERNVAAVCSATNVARLIHHARAFLAAPDEARFAPRDPDPLPPEAVRDHLDRRGTTPVAVSFTAPDLVDDQLYPQLERSLSGIADGLDRRGFDVLRTAAWARDADADGSPAETDGRPAALFVECEVVRRPRIERHEGPPVHVGEHARGFYEQYADDSSVWGPFVDGDRYVVERPREFPTARAFLASDALFSVALGARIEGALRAEYDVLVGEEVAALAETFGAELAQYFSPRP
jgi:tRNA nucleotidyltransferase (CCA-adding enzyme)